MFIMEILSICSMAATHYIHDKGYKRLFRNRKIFRQLMETFVHEPWVSEIDFSSCEALDKSFVSDEYQETESDLIYKVKLRGRDLYIIVLLEFQSTVYRFMAVRVLKYMTDFYLDYIRSNPRAKKLPPIFPIVLYNGKKRWTAPTRMSDLIADPDMLGKFALQCEYAAIIEHAIPRDELLRISNIVSTLFLTEAYYDLDTIKTAFLDLFHREQDREAMSLLFNWFRHLVKESPNRAADSDEMDEHLYQNTEEVAMLVEELRREKRESYTQGRMESKLEDAANMLRKGLSFPLVSEITGLSRERLLQLCEESNIAITPTESMN